MTCPILLSLQAVSIRGLMSRSRLSLKTRIVRVENSAVWLNCLRQVVKDDQRGVVTSRLNLVRNILDQIARLISFDMSTNAETILLMHIYHTTRIINNSHPI